VIECKKGEYFYIASADDLTSATHGTIKSIGRKARRHRVKLSTAKPANETQASIIEHQGRLLRGIERETKKARLNVLRDTRTTAAPRIEPPKAQA